MNRYTVELNEDRRDALQEIMNIAMGKAGCTLANVMGKFVELSIPRFHLSNVSKEKGFLISSQENEANTTIIRQPFAGKLHGEAVVLLSHDNSLTMADLMGYEEQLTPQQEEELLMDVGNILAGACLNGLAEQMNIKVGFSSPSIIGVNETASKFLKNYIQEWEYALIMEVDLGLEEHTFTSNLLFFMAEESFPSLIHSIDTLLESM